MTLKQIVKAFKGKRSQYSRPSLKTVVGALFGFLFIFSFFPHLDAGDDKIIFLDGEQYKVVAQHYWTGVYEIEDQSGQTYKYHAGKKW